MKNIKKYAFTKDRTIWTIVILLLSVFLVILYSDFLNTWQEKNTGVFAALSLITNLLIGFGLILVGSEANKIADSSKEQTELDEERFSYELNQHERDIFKKNYLKVSEALALVMRHGNVTNEALRLFWEARDEARLELPDDIVEYTEFLRKTAVEANSAMSICYDEKGYAKPSHNQKDLDRAHKAEGILYKQNAHEKYRHHMKLGTKKSKFKNK